VNSHATSTPVGDISEIKVHSAFFGDERFEDHDWEMDLSDLQIEEDRLKETHIWAPKGSIGHTFCAAGGVESVLAVK